MFLVGFMLHIFLVFVLSYYVSTFRVLCCDVRYDFHITTYSVHLYLQLFVGGLMHVLFMLIVFVSYSCVLHILCCVFVLFVFVLCTRFSGLSIFDCLWYSLTFIHHAMKNHHSNIVKHLFVVDIELFSRNQ